MQERELSISHINPLILYGTNNKNLNFIQKYYPLLKIVARGDTIKVMGEENSIEDFNEKVDQLVLHIEKYNSLTEEQIETILEGSHNQQSGGNVDEVLVYGNKGIKVKARSANQQKLVKGSHENDLVIVVGPAGTGKTYTAVALAVQALKNKEVRKIILTRPAVEAGENLGFLPGDMRDKLDPYMQPLYDALYDMIAPSKLLSYLETRTIEIAPLAFMRGRTLDHAFVILDEAQNASAAQLKMFLTRMGTSAKFVITGDLTQVDLPKNQQSGLRSTVEKLRNVEGICIVELEGKDVIRHQLVRRIINALKSTKEEEA